MIRISRINSPRSTTLALGLMVVFSIALLIATIASHEVIESESHLAGDLQGKNSSTTELHLLGY